MNQLIPLLLCGFTCAAVLAYGLTWLARIVARPLGYLDKPDGGRKRHGNATPLLGGAAIYLAFGATLAAFFLFGSRNWLQSNSLDFSVLLGSGALFCLLGLWDDKYPLRARDKLLLQILASLPFAIWGQQVTVIHVIGFHFDLGVWSLVFSIFWLVSCANVVNLVDGLDGLASSVGLIAIGTLVVMSRGELDAIVALVALTFAGSIAGFLVHNWPPAKIFLGDAGSLTIGFMVGAIAIESSTKTTAGFMLVFPLVLLGVPILDTAMAILRRKLTGRGIGEADRGHIHHRLQDRGLTKLQTLLSIVGICTTMAVACLIAVNFGQDLIAVVLCVSVIAIIVAGRIFGFHEMSLVFRHFEIFHTTVTEAVRDLTVRRMVVHLEHAESVSLDSLWETVLSRIEDVGVSALEMTCTSEHGNVGVLERHWSDDATNDRQFGEWQLRYSVLRADGLNTSFLILGHQVPGKKAQSLDQITDLFEACNRLLPSIEELRGLSEDARIQSLPRATQIEVQERDATEQRRAA